MQGNGDLKANNGGDDISLAQQQQQQQHQHQQQKERSLVGTNNHIAHVEGLHAGRS